MRVASVVVVMQMLLAITAGAQDPAAQRAAAWPQVLSTVQAAIIQPAPPGLTRAQVARYGEHTEWLKQVHARVEAFALQDGMAPRGNGVHTGRTTGVRQHAPHKVHSSLDRLRADIESEARRFADLDGAAKARHEMAMNSIRNMK